MSERSEGGMALALGIAFAMLIMSVLAPLGWWSEITKPKISQTSRPTMSPRASVDLSAQPRRLEPEVTPEPALVAPSDWDQLRMLAVEPVVLDIEPAVTLQASPARRAEVASSLPTWDGAASVATLPKHRIARRSPPLQPAVARPLTAHQATIPLERRSRELPLFRSTWRAPDSLLSLLPEVGECPASYSWAHAVEAWMEYLANLSPEQSTVDSYAALRVIHAKGQIIASHLQGKERQRLLVANYALLRRLRVWELTDQIGDPAMQVSLGVTPANGSAQVGLNRAIASTRQWLDSVNAKGWNQYLLLPELANASASTSMEIRSQLALRLEERIAQVTEASHLKFIRSEAIQRLRTATRHWAAAIAWDGSLTNVLELAEQGDPAARRKVAYLSQSLQWSSDPRQREIGAHLDQHYRNANLRVSVNEEFLNNWVEDPEPSMQPFQESIMGAEVHGQNYIETRLAVDLRPSPTSWQMLMQAGGEVHTRSSTRKGPATVFSSGLAHYVAEKDIWVTTNHVTSSATRAATKLSTQMDGFKTKFDDIPVLAGLTRTVVKHQHDKQLPRATAMAERKSNDRISHEMDQEVERQLQKATDRIEEEVLKPLRRMRLEAVPTSMSSTHDRAVARGRLAGGAQLAASTPRPTPPLRSVANAQIHQSAVNNLLDGFELAGRRTTIGEVGQEIAKKLDTNWDNEDTPKVTLSTIVSFAEQRPLSIVASDGEVRIHLRLTELDAGGDNFWYDFDVEAVYEPVVEGATLKLVRKRPLRIDAKDEYLGFRDVLALRGVFAKVFDPEKPLVLISKDLAGRKGMQGLAITQCVIANGWLGVALDHQSARQPAQAAATTTPIQTLRR